MSDSGTDHQSARATQLVTRMRHSHAVFLRQEFRLLVACLLAGGAWVATHFGASGYGVLASWSSIDSIEPRLGAAYQSPLGDVVVDEHTRVCEGVPSQTAFFESAEGLAGDTMIHYYLARRIPLRFPEWRPTMWRCSGITRGEDLRGSIRDQGGDLYAVTFEGWLYFTASDSTDPRRNGRGYAFATISGMSAAVRATTTALFTILAAMFVYVWWVRRVVPWVREGYTNSRVGKTVVPATLMSIATVIAMLLLFEAYLRLTVPFTTTQWPSRFDPNLGIVLQPNQSTRWTDHAAFWIEGRSNSLGFLAREPEMPKPPGRFRILLMGDSFVEAAEVETKSKLQVLLEERIAEPEDLDVVAMGYRGTGQTNQLSFYEHLGPALEADLVVLLVTFNDFANNSSVLEAVRYGLDPKHQPRLFFEPVEGGVRRQPIDPNWQAYRFDTRSELAPRDAFAVNQRMLLQRYRALAERFGDWALPDDLNMEDMFMAIELPPVFRDALASTEHTLRVFGNLARRDGAKLLVVAAPNLTGSKDYVGDTYGKRTIDLALRVHRLRAMLQRLDIAMLDLHPAFLERGDVLSARHRFDGHWNERGHRWAADAIAEYLAASPGLMTQ